MTQRASKFYEGIGAPILVNLVSAVILFLLALAFKDRVRELFFGEDKAYPLYCGAEMIQSKDRPGKADVELLIFNLSRKELTRETLQDLLNKQDDSPGARSVDIILRPKDSAKLLQVVLDNDFNGIKGNIIAITNSTEYRIVINQIEPSAILRAVVRTDLDIQQFGRNDKGRVPILIEYPGRKQYGQSKYD